MKITAKMMPNLIPSEKESDFTCSDQMLNLEKNGYGEKTTEPKGYIRGPAYIDVTG